MQDALYRTTREKILAQFLKLSGIWSIFNMSKTQLIGSSTSSVLGFGFGLPDFNSLSQVIALKAHRAGTCKPCAYFFAKADGCRLHNSCEFCRSLSGFLCRLRCHCSECIQTSRSCWTLLNSREEDMGQTCADWVGQTDGTWMPRPFMSSRRN